MGWGTKLTLLISLLFLTYPLAYSVRLSKTIIPTFYNLTLSVNPTDSTFGGNSEITFDATPVGNGANVTEFQIHASSDFINIARIRFNNRDNICNVSSIVEDLVTIKCSKDIQGVNQTLLIPYVGTFSTEDKYGFYKSTYAENGLNKTFVATQFEPGYARRAFPCFDEPEFKANFHVTILHHKNYTALFNTKGSSIASGDLVITSFDTTPKMSTYLVAFIVSELESAGEAPKEANYIFGVYSRSTAIQYTNLPAYYGPILIDLLGNFTGKPYNALGNNKMNLVAVPNTGGAMENWGLITYGEIDLLDEGNATSDIARQSIVQTIAHECSHQWFGDYVTLSWWSETWLNEGFATYFEYHITQLADKNLEMDKQFIILIQQPVLQVDAVPSADPLSSKDEDIDTTVQADSKFGGISYSKGGSILRMIRFILGDNNFQKGLQAYLTKYKHGNAKASYLLETLQDFVPPDQNINLSIYMNSWIYEPGFPLLSVSLDNSVASIQTKKIFSTEATNATTTWYVPVTVTKSDEMDFENISIIWLEPNATLFANLTEDGFVLINLQASGFYRVNYDSALWSRIINALKNDTQRNSIHVLNRAQLVDDIFNIATVDEIDYETAFSLADYLVNETEYYPWYTAFSAFDNLLYRARNSEMETELKNFMLQLMVNVIDIPSSQSENKSMTHIDVLQRSLVLNWACTLGHTECVKFAQQQYANYKKNSSSLVNYNLRELIFCNGLKYSSNPREDFNFLYEILENTNSPQEKADLTNALACTSDLDVLYQYLQKTVMDNSNMRTEDRAKILQAVYTTNPIGVDVAVDFLSTNSDNMSQFFRSKLSTNTVLKGIAKRLTTDDQINKLKKFIEDNNDSEAVKLIKTEVVGLAQANQKWIENHKGQLKSVLTGRPKNQILHKD